MTPQADEGKFSELRQRAETIISEHSPELNDDSPQAMLQLIHELKVHQVELELQNEELRQIQYERELAQKNYADLYHFAPVGYLTLDEDGLIKEANLTGAEMLGLDRKDLIGRRLSSFVIAEDQDAYHFYYQRLAKTDVVQRYEIRLVKKDGTHFYARLEAQRVGHSTLSDSQVESRQYRLVISDISERVQAERARQEAHNFMSAVLDAAGALIIVVDRAGCVVRFNRACEQLSGYRFEAVQGQPIWDLLLPPEERAPVKAVFEQLRAGQFPNEFTNHWLARDGRRHLISWSNTALPDPEGMVQYIIGIGIDITELKQAEEIRAYLAAIVNSSGDAIIGQTLTGLVASWNPGAERLYGYRAGEMIGQSITRLIPAELHAEFFGLMSRVRQGETIENYETQHLTRDGQQLVIALTISPIEDTSGTRLGASAIARDITQRKQAELALTRLLETVSQQREQLRALARRLAETQEAERKTLARELHDQVGQKLTGLNLNLNLIKARLLPSSTATEPLLKVLDQSLKLVEETTEQIQDVMTHLRPPVLDDYGLVAALRWYGTALARWAGFAIVIEGDEPKPRLAASVEHALFRIVQEALTNVSKHARAGRVTVTVAADQDTVRLVVADDGCGFDHAEAPPSGERQHWGLLTMAERAEMVGGRCCIQSQSGQGTQIIVEVPRCA